MLLGPGQTLEPICSNPQGIHVVGEGDSVRVCFTLFNDGDVRLPQRVNFVAESRSDLGQYNTRIVLCDMYW